ncbi:hypothetical protein PMAYCL1PPCAC_03407, partial [Pristionchus mayeri]
IHMAEKPNRRKCSHGALPRELRNLEIDLVMGAVNSTTTRTRRSSMHVVYKEVEEDENMQADDRDRKESRTRRKSDQVGSSKDQIPGVKRSAPIRAANRLSTASSSQSAKGDKQKSIVVIPSTDQSDTKEDEEVQCVLDEIIKRSGEGAKVWDAQWGREQKAGVEGYRLDYVVACTPPEVQPKKHLNKYQNYPIPSWEVASYETDAQREFEKEEAMHDMVEKRLEEELGADEAKRLYPHRFIPYEEGLGVGGYVENERARYFNSLKAFALKINRILAAAGRPKAYVIDWTAGKGDLEGLMAFEFITDLCPEYDVKKLLKKYVLADQIKCDPNSTCGNCNYVATCIKPIKCCGVQQMVAVDEDGNAKLEQASTPAEKEARDNNVQWECIDECHPDEKARARCRNRFIQTGRRQECIFFRHPEKGWTLRSTVEMSRCEFFSDYTGVVKLRASKRGTPEQCYDFLMSQHLKTNEGKVLPLMNICAYSKGNETRLLSHSCNANLSVINIALERNGTWYTHPAFFTNKRILAGAELTFDYFEGNKEVDVSTMFPSCKCAWYRCRYTVEKVAKRKREEAGLSEESEEDEAPPRKKKREDDSEGGAGTSHQTPRKANPQTPWKSNPQTPRKGSKR